jgi:hypothetical protein
MTSLEKARHAIESLKDANPYDPGDVETALDSAASTLSSALLTRRFSKLRPAPSLEDVLEKLKKRAFNVADAEDALGEIRNILDENAYPNEQEIEDASEMEGYLIALSDALLPLVEEDDENEE